MSASKTNCRPRGNATRICLQRIGRRPLRAEPDTSTARSRPRRSVPAPSWSPAAPPGRAPSGYPAAASGHPAWGSPPAAPAPDGNACTKVSGATHATCGRRRSPPPPPASPDRPRPRHDSLAPAPTPPTARHLCGYGQTGRGNADPKTAWPQPIACVEVVARSPVAAAATPVDGPRWPAGVVGPGGPGHALALTSSAARDQSRGPSLPARLLTPISGTTTPSDSRCAPLDFTIGLYDRSLARRGCADGSLLFRTRPVRTCHSPYPGGTRRADPGTGPVRHGLRRDMSGSAPPL